MGGNPGLQLCTINLESPTQGLTGCFFPDLPKYSLALMAAVYKLTPLSLSEAHGAHHAYSISF